MNLLQMSIAGGVMILAVAVIRALFLHKLPKKTFVILWGIVLLRLMIPVSLPSTFSIYSFTPAMDAVKDTPAERYLPIFQEAETVSQPEQPIPERNRFPLWTFIWAAGAVLSALFFVLSYIRCRLDFRTSLPVNHEYADRWLKEHSLRRMISIRQSGCVAAPLTYGIIHPVILMPKSTDWTDTGQMEYVLAHEYTHIRKMDGIRKLALTAALCVHWFNPVVWLMYYLANRDIELCCDEAVVRMFGQGTRSAYAFTLISMEEKKSSIQPLCSNFSRPAIKERITAIMKIKKKSLSAVLAAAGLIIAVSAVFATSAVAANEPVLQLGQKMSQPLSHIGKWKPGSKAETESGQIFSVDSVELRSYEPGYPYLHPVYTNRTDQTVTKIQYSMLAFDKDGQPLKIKWFPMDSSFRIAYSYMTDEELNLKPGKTYDVRGGWSLYPSGDWAELTREEKKEEGSARVVYSMYCISQITFKDGSKWVNPDFENWKDTYTGKKAEVSFLQNYYPREYAVTQ
ncbi:M56 family metallopeptidase [Anaerolentibacter hominis]|uniref:M56 family metallopeptidase n=1 Tax=Anaerolentibacter hominis TaxID=3079009 RepID=UPI0031B7F946